MVRLKLTKKQNPKPATTGFNSSMVRLKLQSAQRQGRHRTQFQFLYGAIKT